MKKINWKELLKACLMIFLCFFICPLLVSLLVGFFPLDDNLYVYVANALNYLLILFILISLSFPSLKQDFKNFKKDWKKDLKIAFSNWLKAFLFMTCTNAILIILLGDMAVNEEANRSIINMFPLFSVISMAFIGPFMEEMLFRKNFKNVFAKKETFLIFTSLLFGFAHIVISMDFSSLSSILNFLKQCLFIIPYGGMGYFFAKAYYETDSIFTSTIMHMFHNSLALFIVLLESLFL